MGIAGNRIRALVAADARAPADPGTLPPRPRCAHLERFDEATLERVAPEVDAVAFVLESHIPTLLAWLRPEEDPEALLAELWHAIELCGAWDVPLEVTVPFLTESASSLPETVAYLADAGIRTVRVVPARAVSGRERPLDPFACFSARYIDRIRLLCEERAQGGYTTLVWEPRAGRTFDLWHLPGFCEEAWGRISVREGLRVRPCIYAAAGELELGSLGEDGLAAVWRGTESLDLRRAHLTWDYPGACVSCSRSAPSLPEQPLPFMERFIAEHGGAEGPHAEIEALSPGPLARVVDAPTITLARGEGAVRAWHLAWSPGGRAEDLAHAELQPAYDGTRAVALAFPPATWAEVTPNIGNWWCVFAELEDGSWAGMRTPRCVVAHQPVARLPGSRLRYPGDPRRHAVGPPSLSPALGEGEYDDLVGRVLAAVRSVVPEGETAVVITKGDDRLLELGGVEAWHFPRSQDGGFAGFHPPDSDWAVDHLRSLHAAGAGYFVLPETAWWWYDEYPGFATYLRERCALVLEERGTCMVVALDVGEKAGA